MSNKELPPLPQIEISNDEFKRSNRRKFMTWLSSGVLAALGIEFLFQAEEDRGVSWPLRKINDITDAFWRAEFKNKLAPTKETPITTKPRLNGNIGLEEHIDAQSWRLKVHDPKLTHDLALSLSDLKKIPMVTETFEFKCVEGWSAWTTFTGIRFSDFMEHNQVGTKAAPGSSDEGELYGYACLTSVNGGYYVAMDLKSLMHPQTLLVFEMNAKVLSSENGYPVRLVSSVNYGVKSIKQIGSILFSDSPPPDYWAENGYSEYLGL